MHETICIVCGMRVNSFAELKEHYEDMHIPVIESDQTCFVSDGFPKHSHSQTCQFCGAPCKYLDGHLSRTCKKNPERMEALNFCEDPVNQPKNVKEPKIRQNFPKPSHIKNGIIFHYNKNKSVVDQVATGPWDRCDLVFFFKKSKFYTTSL